MINIMPLKTQEKGFLTLSKTELDVLSELGNGNKEITVIAKALNISSSQVYRIAQKLAEKNIVTLLNGTIQPEKKTHISMMLNLLSKTKNLSTPLSGTGLQIFCTLISSKKLKEVELETGLHKTTIIKKITQARKLSLLIKEKTTYRINEKIWSDAKDFFIELNKYEESIDLRIPVNSEIYFKDRSNIIFSNKDFIDAEKTAFSAYEKFGIKLLLVTNYYCLPKRKLSKKEILEHSIYIVEKNKDGRMLLFISLFYAKYKKELFKLKHPILENLNKIFKGEKIPSYPTLEDVRERAKIYNIKV